jgi:hypothetical protein
MRSAGIIRTAGRWPGFRIDFHRCNSDSPPKLLEDFTNRLMILPEAGGARGDRTPPCIQ